MLEVTTVGQQLTRTQESRVENGCSRYRVSMENVGVHVVREGGMVQYPWRRFGRYCRVNRRDIIQIIVMRLLCYVCLHKKGLRQKKLNSLNHD